MNFIDWIIEELWDIADWLHEAYYVARDWIYPFNLLKTPLYAIYGRFKWLAGDFEDFKEWLLWAGDLIEDILSWTNIKSLIKSWLYGIENAVSWFSSWAYWVRQEVANWWTGILPYIIDYIDSAVEGLEDFATTWNNFWKFTLPNLVSFAWLTTWWNSRILDVQSLINSAFTLRTSFWEGWQDVREEVVSFFSDPLQWTYDKLDEFFERFW